MDVKMMLMIADDMIKSDIFVLFMTSQAFIGELYVYLIDEMHVALDQVLSVVDQEPVPCPITESAQLKHFAREAEVNENFALAARFYQEVTSSQHRTYRAVQ